MTLLAPLVPASNKGTVAAKIAIGNENNVPFSGVMHEEFKLDEYAAYLMPKEVQNIKGDVLFESRRKTLVFQEVFTSEFFYTGFLGPEKTISFQKYELDIPLDSSLRNFPEDFTVTLNFTQLEDNPTAVWEWEMNQRILGL